MHLHCSIGLQCPVVEKVVCVSAHMDKFCEQSRLDWCLSDSRVSHADYWCSFACKERQAGEVMVPDASGRASARIRTYPDVLGTAVGAAVSLVGRLAACLFFRGLGREPSRLHAG